MHRTWTFSKRLAYATWRRVSASTRRQRATKEAHHAHTRKVHCKVPCLQCTLKYSLELGFEGKRSALDAKSCRGRWIGFAGQRGKFKSPDGRHLHDRVRQEIERDGGKSVRHREQDPALLSATLSTAMSAGVTPGTRDAWPRLWGRMRESFSRDSKRSAPKDE